MPDRSALNVDYGLEGSRSALSTRSGWRHVQTPVHPPSGTCSPRDCPYGLKAALLDRALVLSHAGSVGFFPLSCDSPLRRLAFIQTTRLSFSSARRRF